MKISMSFEFESIEEMKTVVDKLSGSEAVQSFTTTAKDVAPQAETKATTSKAKATKTAEKPAEKPAPVPEVANANPFAGMPEVVQPEPPKTEAPKPESRQSLLDEVTSAINGWTAAGIEMAEIAKTFNERFFMPAGMQQVKLSQLDDASLVKFVEVFRASIKAHVDGLKNNGALV